MAEENGSHLGLRPSTPPSGSREQGSPQSPYVIIHPQTQASLEGEVRGVGGTGSGNSDQPYMLPPPLQQASADQQQQRSSSSRLTTIASSRLATGSTSRTTASRLSVRSVASTAGSQPPTGPRPRPRFWLVLVLIVLVDVILEGIVGGRLIAKNGQVEVNPGSTTSSPADGSDGGQKSQRIVSLTVAILGASAMRNATIAVVAIGNKTDQLGLTVAGVCALSALILVSIFNLLFQSGMLWVNAAAMHLYLPRPSLSLLTSIGLVFTMIEYIAYVLVVGIRIPPTGVSAARMREARRWKRGVRASEAFPHHEEHEEVFRNVESTGSEPAMGTCATTSKRQTRDSKYGAINSTVGDDDDATPPSRSHHLTPDREEQQHSLSTSYGSRQAPRGSPLAQSLSTSYGSRQPPKSSPLAQLFPAADNDIEAARPEVGYAHDQGKDVHDQSGEHFEADDHGHDGGDVDEDGDHGNADDCEDPEAQPLAEDLDEIDAESNDDPNEIMDIPTASTSMTRDQSRARLALAMSQDAEERKRRSRTLSQLSRRSRPSPHAEEPEPEPELEHEEEEEQGSNQRDRGREREGPVDVAFQSLEPPRQQQGRDQASTAGAQQSKKPRFGLSFASAGSPSNTGPLSPLDTTGRAPKPSAKNKDNKVAAKIKNVFKR